MIPLNRYLLVNLPKKVKEEQESPSNFYLPDDVVLSKNSYEVVEVVAVSAESKFFAVLDKGDSIVVEGHMLRSVDVYGETSTLIEDNYVFGKC
jgi:co-chaperonin GroES (HSP10)